MPEIRTVTTLRRKRDEIRRTIRDYEKRLDQARADLAHIAAAIAIFEGRHIIHQLRRQHQQETLLIDGKRQAAIFWKLPADPVLI